ncbi:MAG: hypothetical protein HWE25_15300 [Alphaproteobacteria bacterium]|nr:hypothetical protein [Alphaproteobacteria bacterium]
MAGQNGIGFLKRMFTPAGVTLAPQEVTIGDRFLSRDAQASVWVVERISSVDASSFPLVSLSREGRPDLKKIVSIAVLQDGEDFRPAH